MVRDIDLSRFKVVHRDRVYNAVALVGMEFPENRGEVTVFVKPKNIVILVVNEDGNLMCIDDEAWTFQFLPRESN